MFDNEYEQKYSVKSNVLKVTYKEQLWMKQNLINYTF